MRTPPRPRIRRLFLIAGAVPLLCLAVLFVARAWLLERALEKVRRKVEEKTGLLFNWKAQGFSGLRTVWMTGISVVPAGGDTLLRIDSVSVVPSLWSALTGMPGISGIRVRNGLLQLVESDGRSNYSALLRARSDSTRTVESLQRSGADYATLLHRVIDQAFALAPQQADLESLRFIWRRDTAYLSLLVPRFTSDRDALSGEVIDERTRNRWTVSGNFSQRKEVFDLTVAPGQAERRLPLAILGWDLTAGFDTLHLGLYESGLSRKTLKLQGYVSVECFFLHQPRISDDTVRIEHARFDGLARIKGTHFELDSSSTAELNRITIHLGASFDKTRPWKAGLHLKTDPVRGTDFFRSLPEGIFESVRDIEADGTLSFHLDFSVDRAMPDSVRFDCGLDRDKFRIRSYGSSGLSRMNGEFTHAVYEYGRYVRSFTVGPSNPSFTPLDLISPYFRNAVLTSEDGNFFYHAGFNEDAFRKSIATNLEQGRFARGGSTISMQLVKNVFLTRKKTIARKAEEALIVWLIERNRITTKERMFEVYLNIVELGPNVYGIGEAAPYYFSKRPADLNLNESIFLAGLLPRPKAFRFAFDSTGVLKPYMAGYYRIVSNFLLRKNLITQQEYDALAPNVTLTGPARDVVLPEDSVGAEDPDAMPFELKQ
jgi:hypothetical protein